MLGARSLRNEPRYTRDELMLVLQRDPQRADEAATIALSALRTMKTSTMVWQYAIRRLRTACVVIQRMVRRVIIGARLTVQHTVDRWIENDLRILHRLEAAGTSDGFGPESPFLFFETPIRYQVVEAVYKEQRADHRLKYRRWLHTLYNMNTELQMVKHDMLLQKKRMMPKGSITASSSADAVEKHMQAVIAGEALRQQRRSLFAGSLGVGPHTSTLLARGSVVASPSSPGNASFTSFNQSFGGGNASSLTNTDGVGMSPRSNSPSKTFVSGSCDTPTRRQHSTVLTIVDRKAEERSKKAAAKAMGILKSLEERISGIYNDITRHKLHAPRFEFVADFKLLHGRAMAIYADEAKRRVHAAMADLAIESRHSEALAIANRIAATHAALAASVPSLVAQHAFRIKGSLGHDVSYNLNRSLGGVGGGGVNVASTPSDDKKRSSSRRSLSTAATFVASTPAARRKSGLASGGGDGGVEGGGSLQSSPRLKPLPTTATTTPMQKLQGAFDELASSIRGEAAGGGRSGGKPCTNDLHDSATTPIRHQKTATVGLGGGSVSTAFAPSLFSQGSTPPLNNGRSASGTTTPRRGGGRDWSLDAKVGGRPSSSSSASSKRTGNVNPALAAFNKVAATLQRALSQQAKLNTTPAPTTRLIPSPPPAPQQHQHAVSSAAVGGDGDQNRSAHTDGITKEGGEDDRRSAADDDDGDDDEGFSSSLPVGPSFSSNPTSRVQSAKMPRGDTKLSPPPPLPPSSSAEAGDASTVANTNAPADGGGAASNDRFNVKKVPAPPPPPTPPQQQPIVLQMSNQTFLRLATTREDFDKYRLPGEGSNTSAASTTAQSAFFITETDEAFEGKLHSNHENPNEEEEYGYLKRLGIDFPLPAPEAGSDPLLRHTNKNTTNIKNNNNPSHLLRQHRHAFASLGEEEYDADKAHNVSAVSFEDEKGMLEKAEQGGDDDADAMELKMEMERVRRLNNFKGQSGNIGWSGKLNGGALSTGIGAKPPTVRADKLPKPQRDAFNFQRTFVPTTTVSPADLKELMPNSEAIITVIGKGGVGVGGSDRIVYNMRDEEVAMLVEKQAAAEAHSRSLRNAALMRGDAAVGSIHSENGGGNDNRKLTAYSARRPQTAGGFNAMVSSLSGHHSAAFRHHNPPPTVAVSGTLLNKASTQRIQSARARIALSVEKDMRDNSRDYVTAQDPTHKFVIPLRHERFTREEMDALNGQYPFHRFYNTNPPTEEEKAMRAQLHQLYVEANGAGSSGLPSVSPSSASATTAAVTASSSSPSSPTRNRVSIVSALFGGTRYQQGLAGDPTSSMRYGLDLHDVNKKANRAKQTTPRAAIGGATNKDHDQHASAAPTTTAAAGEADKGYVNPARTRRRRVANDGEDANSTFSNTDGGVKRRHPFVPTRIEVPLMPFTEQMMEDLMEENNFTEATRMVLRDLAAEKQRAMSSANGGGAIGSGKGSGGGGGSTEGGDGAGGGGGGSNLPPPIDSPSSFDFAVTSSYRRAPSSTALKGPITPLTCTRNHNRGIAAVLVLDSAEEEVVVEDVEVPTSPSLVASPLSSPRKQVGVSFASSSSPSSASPNRRAASPTKNANNKRYKTRATTTIKTSSRHLIATGAFDGMLKIVSFPDTTEVLHRLGSGGMITDMLVSRDKSTLIVVSDDSTVRLFKRRSLNQWLSPWDLHATIDISKEKGFHALSMVLYGDRHVIVGCYGGLLYIVPLTLTVGGGVVLDVKRNGSAAAAAVAGGGGSLDGLQQPPSTAASASYQPRPPPTSPSSHQQPTSPTPRATPTTTRSHFSQSNNSNSSGGVSLAPSPSIAIPPSLSGGGGGAAAPIPLRASIEEACVLVLETNVSGVNKLLSYNTEMIVTGGLDAQCNVIRMVYGEDNVRRMYERAVASDEALTANIAQVLGLNINEMPSHMKASSGKEVDEEAGEDGAGVGAVNAGARQSPQQQKLVDALLPTTLASASKAVSTATRAFAVRRTSMGAVGSSPSAQSKRANGGESSSAAAAAEVSYALFAVETARPFTCHTAAIVDLKYIGSSSSTGTGGGGDLVCSASLDKTICVWDALSFDMRFTFRLTEVLRSPMFVIPRDDIIVCALQNGTMIALSARSGTVVSETNHNQLKDLCKTGCLIKSSSSSETLVAFGSYGGRLLVFNPRRGTIVASRAVHSGAVLCMSLCTLNSAAIADDGADGSLSSSAAADQYLVSCSDDRVTLFSAIKVNV